MGTLDYQLGVASESTYGTIVTPSRFFEYNGDTLPIKAVAGRTEGSPMRVGSRARRFDRSTPYFHHGEGTISLDVMTKGFGFWLQHMLGNVATTGVGPFTHTATEGGTSSLIGKSFTAQFNTPFTPTGTNQAVTYSGGKVKSWTLTSDVDANLIAELECDFAAMSTGTALATASYPATMNNLTWAGGVVTIGGTAVDVTKFAVAANNNQNVDRRRIRGNTAEKEPTPGRLEVGVTIECDFDALTHWNRVYATSRSATQAAVVGTWTNGTDVLTVTVPSVRFDELEVSGDTDLSQGLSGIGEYDGTNSVVTVAYTTADTTP